MLPPIHFKNRFKPDLPILFEPIFRYKFELPPGRGTLNDSTNITANQNSRWMVKRLQVGREDEGGGIFMFILLA